MKEEILSFIKTMRESFIGSEVVYTQGSCYQFYRILANRFPSATPYYNSDHVITRIRDSYYDITGEVYKTNHLDMEEHYTDSTVREIRYSVFERDAILQLNKIL